MNDYNFTSASKGEQIVFGAQRPGYYSLSVGVNKIQEWTAFMKKQGIQRICCLLSPKQLKYYETDLLERYRQEFGQDNVCWAPIEDFHLCDLETLKKQILPFLDESDKEGKHVLVHCSGGSGRTGHVLAAWLVFGRGLSVEDALKAVKDTGRNPYEAVNSRNATEEELFALLQACREGNIA